MSLETMREFLYRLLYQPLDVSLRRHPPFNKSQVRKMTSPDEVRLAHYLPWVYVVLGIL